MLFDLILTLLLLHVHFQLLIKLNKPKTKSKQQFGKVFRTVFLWFVSFLNDEILIMDIDYLPCYLLRREKNTATTFAGEFSKWKQFRQLFTILSPRSFDSLIVIVFLFL